MTLKTIISGSATSGSLTHEIAYALFRCYCGISIALGAGLSKVFHKINPDGREEWSNLALGVPDWFVRQVGEIGFTFVSPSIWAYLAVYGEFIGGLLVAFGLFTRISAIQMAFQFFVVSFIWYDEPELFGMYYQQLIFWAFVLIAALGGGRISLDNWSKKIHFKKISAKNAVMLGGLMLLPILSMAQTRAEMVHFRLHNADLKTRHVDIRYYDNNRATGYGYDLGALSSHAVTKQTGTRIYLKKSGGWSLIKVIEASDEGKTLDVNKSYIISPEQRAQASLDEKRQEELRLIENQKSPDMEQQAQEKGLPMITITVAGNTLFNKTIIVRAQLPYEEGRTNIGFRQKLNAASRYKVSYPLGTKIYLCEGAYWSDKPGKETLVVTLDKRNQNSLIRL